MRKGFTLVEIMIVVAIIALLAALTIPNLMRQRLNTNEAAAQHTLQTVSSAEISYRTANALYGTLAQLIAANPAYIDATVAAGAGKQGYVFTDGEAVPTANIFSISAVPVTLNQTGARSFCVTDDGVVRVQATGAAPGNRAACMLLPATQ
ncbi:MAG: prepilin-type N-terminal cleavage/methylation domain-containing protein [Candidatus Omnitrophota bacterium]|nr:prepilin-type N-terminal cleavage/methylation domain-containing protein [Candidatus Omnitrophota bacterium]